MSIEAVIKILVRWTFSIQKEAEQICPSPFNRFASLQADAFHGRAVSPSGFAVWSHLSLSAVGVAALRSATLRYNLKHRIHFINVTFLRYY